AILCLGAWRRSLPWRVAPFSAWRAAPFPPGAWRRSLPWRVAPFPALARCAVLCLGALRRLRLGRSCAGFLPPWRAAPCPAALDACRRCPQLSGLHL
uniref:Secreted protein n=1 Tax=Macrostomum lignano TaxID=282301 RepID=A0A1I8H9A0_9PLAT